MPTTLSLTGLNLINGQWVGESDTTTHAVSPTTGLPLDPAFQSATPAEIDAAFAAAVAAFEATRSLPAEPWAKLLDTIADKIMALGDGLLTVAGAESALPPARLTGERARTCGQLKLFAQLVRDGNWVDAVIDTADPARQPLPKPDVRRMLRPIGPVVVFDASNFPFAFGACGGDTASALAVGNPVIVKAHSAHPATDELFAGAVLEALRACNLPDGLFALVHGSGSKVGAALVKHPAAKAVGFTGSKAGGRALFDIAAARPEPIPVYAEMGSLNPLVVLPAAIAQKGDAIADGLSGSVTLGAGQFCTKPGLVFVIEGPQTDRFVDTLAAKLGAMANFTMLNPGIQKAFAEVVAAMKAAAGAGVKVRVSGTCAPPAGVSPVLIDVASSAFRANAALHEEAFGPATVVVRCKDANDLLAMLPLAGGNLTGSVHTTDGEDATLLRRVVETLERHVGRIVFNGYPTGVEVCHAMVHGGPYPATTAPASTSVGTLAIRRFTRPIAWQNTPDTLLPAALQKGNPGKIWRTVNGQFTRDPA